MKRPLAGSSKSYNNFYINLNLPIDRKISNCYNKIRGRKHTIFQDRRHDYVQV